MEDPKNTDKEKRKSNLRLGLILASIATMFFIGIIIKQWLYSS